MASIPKRKTEMLRIYTDAPTGEVAKAATLRFMVGDVELGEITDFIINPKTNDIVTATITLAVRLG